MFQCNNHMYENLFQQGVSICEPKDSLIAIAKKELFLPEKKIVLLDEMTEEETVMFKSLGAYKGGRNL
ncbi:hypothetical protein [Hominifimenecus sp. rT4P-3]|uniref:hypothetical protein n=1 Tax=Hominifimenecus sp. rT4P-3 TaxID=3242979 RepID=UPI003DA471E1